MSRNETKETSHMMYVDGKIRSVKGLCWGDAVLKVNMRHLAEGKPKPKIQRVNPEIDVSTCSMQDLKDIIRTDPHAAPAYSRELKRLQRQASEVDHWERKFA